MRHVHTTTDRFSSKGVYCPETEKIYFSIGDVCRMLGLSRNGVSGVLNHRQNSTKSYTFYWSLEEPKKGIDY